MKAVLLVGGEGTRLRPLTTRIPKPLVPILNLPYLEQLLFFLGGFGVEEVILTACYLSDQIKAFCGRSSEFGIRLTYVVEAFPLGTGGAVGNVASHLEETFLVFNGDILTNFDLEKLIGFHRAAKGGMTLALVPVPDPTHFGVADLRPDGRIARFVEKPSKEEAPSSLINAGIYVVDPEILGRIPRGVKFSIERGLFPSLAEEGLLRGLVQEAYWRDIGTPQGYLQAHYDYLEGRIALKAGPGSRDQNAFIGEGTEVDSTARIGPRVVIGRNCRIRKGVLISESVLWDSVVVEEGAGVERAIIGSGFRLESGARVRQKMINAEGEKAF